MFENKQIIAAFIEPQPMKQVSYHNHLLYVPISTRYIATNANGDIYAFPTKPKFSVAGFHQHDGWLAVRSERDKHRCC